MAIAPLSLRANYWQELTVTEEDLEFLYNHLLDNETPQTAQELAMVLVEERIRREKQALESQQTGNGSTYLPKNEYQVGQQVSFPALDWQQGEVVGLREGKNPEYGAFKVIDVRLASGETRAFAAELAEHTLNDPVVLNLEDPALNSKQVFRSFGREITAQINDLFEANEDLVRIAGRWFPRALLVDVNIGYLNLAEAVLEMENGGPLPTSRILEQIELPTDVNPKLTEFSLNLALEEDDRFDEVGPSGEVLWFLHRLEPEQVRTMPRWLQFHQPDVHPEQYAGTLRELEDLVTDEHEIQSNPAGEVEEVTLSLIYPHWRAGTLPLSKEMRHLFPTAYESPRVRFSFVDAETKQSHSGWVVRPFHYIYGLRDWYLQNDMLPGSLIRVRRGANPGEVLIQALRKRPTKEWVRTVLVGADGGLVFAMLKQQISSQYDERMIVALADAEALDQIWEQGGRRPPLEQSVINTMRELVKLNPQGQVHAQELYAAANVVRRVSPAAVLQALVDDPAVAHLGDLYFRMQDDGSGE